MRPGGTARQGVCIKRRGRCVNGQARRLAKRERRLPSAAGSWFQRVMSEAARRSSKPRGASRRWREMDWQDWLRGMAVAVAAGLFLAFSGAFFDGEATLGSRLVYWLSLMVAGAGSGGVIAARVAAWKPLQGRTWLTWAVITLVLTVPYTVAVWLITGVAFHNRLNPVDIPRFVPPVMMVSGAMTVLSMLVARGPRETHAAAEGSPPPRFLERLPLKLRGAEVWAVEAEDHYLRVHTDRGSDLILMRLSDAVTELEGIEGAQTHRSWWVAKDAVIDAERGDGRATFTLKNGVKVPVSRTHAKVLRAEGWY